MIVEGQALFNIAIGISGALGGWVLRTLWDSVQELHKEDKALADRINAIDVLVAGQYVKRDYFEMQMAKLFEKLDRIDSKLDSKADKAR